MTIKQISLFLLIFVISGLSNTIISMDQIKKVIESEMLKLDQIIINSKGEASIEKLQNAIIDKENNEQIEKINKEIEKIKKEELEIQKIKMNELEKTKDNLEKKRDDCWRQRLKEINTLYFWQSYTVDCTTLSDNYHNIHNEYIDAYKQYNNTQNIIHDLHQKIINIKYQRSPQQKNQSQNKYFNNAEKYREFEATFERCGRLNNMNCFQDLEKEIREWNQNN